MVTGPVHPDDPLIGVTLGERYKIVKSIGEGGMGIVYEAIHVVIEKKVALKVLRDDFSKRPEVVERFRQEAKSASRIGHEHIVDISDFGETPRGQSYFVMEYLEGEDLANILAREGTLAPGRAVSILLQCAKALGAAHVKGIVHRDMKPENIFLTARDDQPDFVKIVDFGIAKMSDIETEGAPGRKLTKTGMIFGTPEYMSPEQAAGKPLDHRVDIYALGVILFECLTGRVPFVGDTFMGILTQHMFEQPPPLRAVNPHVRCPEELEVVINKTLAKDPDARYQTMDELGRGLASAMDLSGAFTDPTMVGYGDPVKTVRRGPRIIEAQRADSDEFPRTRRSAKTGLVLALGAAIAVTGGVGLYLLLGAEPTAANGGTAIATAGAEGASVGGSAGAAGTESPVHVASAAPDAGLGGSAAETEAGGTEPVPAEPPMVRIDVRTDPAGATVTVDELGTVCEPTPCSFESRAGKGIRLRARLGRQAAVRDLRPAADRVVELSLVRRTRVAPRQTDDAMDMDMGSPRLGDLKTPDIFR
jgi:serine/threonine-protein kinase